jgi:hypothetical protein
VADYTAEQEIRLYRTLFVERAIAVEEKIGCKAAQPAVALNDAFQVGVNKKHPRNKVSGMSDFTQRYENHFCLVFSHKYNHFLI